MNVIEAIVGSRLSVEEVRTRQGEAQHFVGENLTDLNLTDLDLSHAVFLNCDLSGARLHRVNLNGTRFTGTRMSGTDFSGARCANTIFERVRLERANFTSAQAEKARFDDCYIQDTFFFDADLRGASFEKSRLVNVRFDSAALDTKDRVQLQDACFDDAHCEGVNFAKTVLQNTRMRNCSLGKSNLTDTLLSETDMEGADLRQTSGFIFDNTYLRGARLPRSPGDNWSRLRRAYSGPMLLFHTLLLTAFLLPYVAQILFWKAVNQSQQLLATAQQELAEIEKAQPPLTLSETVPAELQALWLRDGFDHKMLGDAVTTGVAAIAATDRSLRSETRQVKASFERLWRESGLNPAALPLASRIVPAHAQKLFKQVEREFQRTEQSLELMWQARGFNKDFLPDARAALMLSLLRARDELRAEALRQFSQRARRIKPCLKDQCAAPLPVWKLLLGFKRDHSLPQQVLTMLLLLYNLLRGVLTYMVSILRDDEDRTGYSPSRSEYRRLFWPYWPMYLLVCAALLAFVMHAWEYLFKMTVILPQ